jgi:hypothetical protein
MIKDERKFKCLRCDWVSGKFGSRGHIDKKALSKAQEELKKHYSEKHPNESFFDKSVKVIIQRIEINA